MKKKMVRIRAPKPATFQRAEHWRSTAEFQIFFLWVQKHRPNNLAPNVDLRAADTSRAKIELHADMVRRDEPDAEAIWIEERVTNHLYGQRDVAFAFKFRDLAGLWKREE